MIEIKTILCPIDFSDYSRRALDHAVTIARWYDTGRVHFGTLRCPGASAIMAVLRQRRASAMWRTSRAATMKITSSAMFVA